MCWFLRVELLLRLKLQFSRCLSRWCGGQPLRGRRSEISLSAHCRGRPPCLPVFFRGRGSQFTYYLLPITYYLNSLRLGDGGQTRESAPTCGCRGFGLGLWVGALGWCSCSGEKSILAPPYPRTSYPRIPHHRFTAAKLRRKTNSKKCDYPETAFCLHYLTNRG